MKLGDGVEVGGSKGGTESCIALVLAAPFWLARLGALWLLLMAFCGGIKVPGGTLNLEAFPPAVEYTYDAPQGVRR